jgi:hypothetical protein
VIQNMALNAENEICCGTKGCELLITTLKEYRSNADVVKKVCRSIQNIAANAENKIKLGKAGGCELSAGKSHA